MWKRQLEGKPDMGEDEDLKEYRKLLVTLDQKAQEDFDKAVISLSGGALGVSFAFVKDIVGNKPIIHSECLFGAWLVWGLSLVFVLASFYVSEQALRQAIRQVDADKIRDQVPGGRFSTITAGLNILGGVAFFSGVVFMVIFVSQNLR